MREDMYKVIVERPRRGKQGDARAARLREDFDGPTRLGMRAGYGHRNLNENLAPLRRFLNAQIGRPWNQVFSEICSGIDRRNTVQQHIHQHIRDFIAVNVAICDGQPIDLAPPWGFLWSNSGISQELYVDPRTGRIRPNKEYRSWRRAAAERRKSQRAEIANRRRAVDERTLLLLLDDAWFEVEVDLLPKESKVESVVGGRPHRRTAEPRYDVVLRRCISRSKSNDVRDCEHFYGSPHVYAVRKRQISTKEIKAYGLRQISGLVPRR